MKKVVVLGLLLSVAVLTAMAQKPGYSIVKNQDLTYVLNNIEKTTSYTDNTGLNIHIYKIADPSGSAHTEGTDEITHSIYIAVSEDGESPEQHVYRLSSVLDPEFVNWVKSPKAPKLVMTYGPANKRRTASIQITLRKLTIN